MPNKPNINDIEWSTPEQPNPSDIQWEGEKGFLSETVSNIPSSAFEYGKNIVEGIKHPIDTLSALAKTLKGFDVKLRRAEGQTIAGTPEETEAEQYADHYGKMMVDRYGSPENIVATAQKDPVGFLSDLSTVFTGTGGIASKIGPISKVGKTVSTIGKTVEPINLAKKATGLGLNFIPKGAKWGPEGLYQSALKMPKSEKWGVERRLKAAETGLEERVLPTVKGYEKLWDKITTISDEVKSKVNEWGKKGEVIQVDDVLKELDELRARYMNKPTPQPYLDALQEFENQFRLAHSTSKKGGIPIDKAYDIKQEVYRSMQKKYNSPVPPPVNPAMEMSVAKGIRQEMEKLHPEELAILKREGKLLDLENAIVGAVRRIPDRDLIGIGTPIKVGVGAATGHFSLGALASLIDNPYVKSAVAIFLNEVRKGKISPTMTTARQLGYQMGKIPQGLGITQ